MAKAVLIVDDNAFIRQALCESTGINGLSRHGPNKSVQMDTNVGGRFFGASYIHKLTETFVSILHTEMSLLFLKVDDHGR